jgi:pyruvate/2-oxoglutarate dehydrogenase complex dihydrolipoamide acyltransferase (E2) component
MYIRLPVRSTEYFDIQRRVAAHKTTESWREVPHTSLVLNLDVTGLLALKDSLKTDPAFAGVRVTFHCIMLKAIALALVSAPRMSAFLAYNRHAGTGKIIYPDEVNIAMPVMLPSGETITPVMHRVDKMCLRAVCLAMAELRDRVRNTDPVMLLFEAGRRDTLREIGRGRFFRIRRLFAAYLGRGRLRIPSRRERKEYLSRPPDQRITPENLTSATVLVSNIGNAVPGMPLTIGLLEVIRPQTTAIGISPVRRMPWLVEDETGERIEIRDICPVTACSDHRAVDFAHVKAFYDTLVGISHDPQRLLEEPGGA